MDTIQFQIINPGEVLKLQKILEKRLPKSAHIYNMVIFYVTKFSSEMEFYIWNAVNTTDFDGRKCWILGKYKRPDDYQQFVISTPDQVQEPDLNLFVSSLRATSVIDWELSYEFVAIDRSISPNLVEISIAKGNCIEIMPCIYYIMEPDEATKLVLSKNSTAVEFVKTLDSEVWLDHLFNHWPRVNDKTQIYRTDMAKLCPGIGALITDDKQEQRIVSSATVNPIGHIGIVTNEAYRNMGYVTACFQHLVNFLAKETDLFPCTMVGTKNNSSIRVHSKLGFKQSHLCDFIFYKN